MLLHVVGSILMYLGVCVCVCVCGRGRRQRKLLYLVSVSHLRHSHMHTDTHSSYAPSHEHRIEGALHPCYNKTVLLSMV